MDELTLLRGVTRRLPPLPKMRGLANQVVRRLYLRKGRPTVVADVQGLKLELDPEELTEGLMLFTPQLFDRREMTFLHRRLGPGDTFLDLGAHVGLYALVAARLVGPSGRVLAVEPEPVSRARLLDNARRNGLDGIEVSDAGLSDRPETRRLAPGPRGNRGATRLVSKGDGVPVPCLPVVDLLAQRGIQRVTGAKVDLEGADARVLQQWLAQGPAPRFLVVEQLPGQDLRTLLHRHGYRVAPGTRHNLMAWREP